MKVSWGDNRYADALKGYYTEMRLTEVQKKKRNNPKLFDVNEKDQADMAARILASTFEQKAKLEGYR